MEKLIILLALASIATCGNLNNEYLPAKEGGTALNSVFRPTFRSLQTTNGNGFQPQANGFLAGLNNGAFPKSQFTPVTSRQQYSSSVAPKQEYGVPSLTLQKSAAPEGETGSGFNNGAFPKSYFTPVTSQQQYSSSVAPKQEYGVPSLTLQKSAAPEGETGSAFAQQVSATPRLLPGASFSSQNQFAPVATLYGVPLAPQKASVLPNFQPSFQQFRAPTTKYQSGPSFSRQYETDDSVITESDGPSFREQYQASPLAKAQFGSQQFGQAPAAAQYNGPQQQYGAPSTFGYPSQFGGKASFQQYPTSQIGDSSASGEFAGRKFGVPSTLHRSASILPKQQYGTVQDSQGGYKY